MRDVPGEVFIGSNETAGLPGRDVEKYAKEQAEKVVRAHKYNLFHFSGKSRRRSANDPKGKKSRRDYFKERSERGDVEKGAEAFHESAPHPTGVLSALLSMYDSMQSGATTPTVRSSFDESRPSSPYVGPISTSSSMMPPPPVPRSSDTGIYFAQNTSASSLRAPSHPWTKTIFGDGRPAKTRSGAGVFGPLIASAGNIAGVAAPTPATVAPDLKRPGYHLSRYVKWYSCRACD